MRSMKKLLVATACLGLLACAAGRAGVTRSGTTGQYLYGSDGSTLLPGNRTRNTTDTGLIQLLYLGPNGSYDSPDALTPGTSGDGTHGDDLLIAQSWVGEGNTTFAPIIPGVFTASDQPDTDAYTSGIDDFAIRVFDTAVSDADWTAGNIPTSGYYDFVEFIDPTKVALGNDYQLYIDSALTTSKSVVIPEPSTLLLVAGGLLSTLLLRKRHR